MKKRILSLALTLALVFALAPAATAEFYVISGNILVFDYPQFQLAFPDYIGDCTVGTMSDKNDQHFEGMLKESDLLHVFLIESDDIWSWGPTATLNDEINGIKAEALQYEWTKRFGGGAWGTGFIKDDFYFNDSLSRMYYFEHGIKWVSIEMSSYKAFADIANDISIADIEVNFNLLLLTPSMADEFLEKGTYIDSYYLYDDDGFPSLFYDSDPFELHGLEDIIIRARDGLPAIGPEKPEASNPLDSASDWARPAITSALGKGFVPKDLQANYKTPITRAEFCRMAIMYIEYVTDKDIDSYLTDKGVKRNPDAFTDTSDPYILAASALGVTTGTGVKQFSPDRPFTRESAAGMIKNVCAALGYDVDGSSPAGFADADSISVWTADGVNYCVANGIMVGGSGNMFNPKNPFSREMSIMTFDNMKPETLTKATPSPEPSSPDASAWEKEVFDLVNIERVNHGLALLVWDEELSEIARNYSVDMAARGFSGTVNPDGKHVLEDLKDKSLPVSYTIWTVTERQRTPNELVGIELIWQIPVVANKHIGVGFHYSNGNNYWTVIMRADHTP